MFNVYVDTAIVLVTIWAICSYTYQRMTGLTERDQLERKK